METSGIGQTEIQGAPRVLPLGDLCIAAGIPCPAGAEKLQIHGITAASARVRPGWLFAALGLPSAFPCRPMRPPARSLPDWSARGTGIPAGACIWSA